MASIAKGVWKAGVERSTVQPHNSGLNDILREFHRVVTVGDFTYLLDNLLAHGLNVLFGNDVQELRKQISKQLEEMAQHSRKVDRSSPRRTLSPSPFNPAPNPEDPFSISFVQPKVLHVHPALPRRPASVTLPAAPTTNVNSLISLSSGSTLPHSDSTRGSIGVGLPSSLSSNSALSRGSLSSNSGNLSLSRGNNAIRQNPFLSATHDSMDNIKKDREWAGRKRSVSPLRPHDYAGGKAPLPSITATEPGGDKPQDDPRLEAGRALQKAAPAPAPIPVAVPQSPSGGPKIAPLPLFPREVKRQGTLPFIMNTVAGEDEKEISETLAHLLQDPVVAEEPEKAAQRRIRRRSSFSRGDSFYLPKVREEPAKIGVRRRASFSAATGIESDMLAHNASGSVSVLPQLLAGIHDSPPSKQDSIPKFNPATSVKKLEQKGSASKMTPSSSVGSVISSQESGRRSNANLEIAKLISPAAKGPRVIRSDVVGGPGVPGVAGLNLKGLPSRKNSVESTVSEAPAEVRVMYRPVIRQKSDDPGTAGKLSYRAPDRSKSEHPLYGNMGTIGLPAFDNAANLPPALLLGMGRDLPVRKPSFPRPAEGSGEGGAAPNLLLEKVKKESMSQPSADSPILLQKVHEPPVAPKDPEVPKDLESPEAEDRKADGEVVKEDVRTFAGFTVKPKAPGEKATYVMSKRVYAHRIDTKGKSLKELMGRSVSLLSERGSPATTARLWELQGDYESILADSDDSEYESDGESSSGGSSMTSASIQSGSTNTVGNTTESEFSASTGTRPRRSSLGSESVHVPGPKYPVRRRANSVTAGNSLMPPVSEASEDNLDEDSESEAAYGHVDMDVDLATVVRHQAVRRRRFSIDHVVSPDASNAGVRELMEVIVRNANDALIVTDSRGRIKLFNPAAEKMFDYRFEEVLQKPASILIPQGDMGETEYADKYSSIGLAEKLDELVEAVAIRRDGNMFPVEVLSKDCSEQTSGKTRVDGGLFIGVIRDITDRKAADHRVLVEQARSHALLLNVLPAPVAERLQRDMSWPIADRYEHGAVLFADIVGFTETSRDMIPGQVVALLDELFSVFDNMCEEFSVEKIKTIGDGYMVAAGVLPEEEHHYEEYGNSDEEEEEPSQSRDEHLCPICGLHRLPMDSNALAPVAGWRRESTADARSPESATPKSQTRSMSMSIARNKGSANNSPMVNSSISFSMAHGRRLSEQPISTNSPAPSFDKNAITAALPSIKQGTTVVKKQPLSAANLRKHDQASSFPNMTPGMSPSPHLVSRSRTSPNAGRNYGQTVLPAINETELESVPSHRGSILKPSLLSSMESLHRNMQALDNRSEVSSNLRRSSLASVQSVRSIVSMGPGDDEDSGSPSSASNSTRRSSFSDAAGVVHGHGSDVLCSCPQALVNDALQTRKVKKVRKLPDAMAALENVAHYGLAMIKRAKDFEPRWASYTGSKHKLRIRIGMHCGPVVAGVIGMKKFAFDLWGDTVNLSSRMESTGLPGKIQVTSAVRNLLCDKFEFIRRGIVNVKGQGKQTTFFLIGPRDRKPDTDT